MFAAVVAALVLTAIAAVLISPAVPSDPTLLPVSTLLLAVVIAVASLRVCEGLVLTMLHSFDAIVRPMNLELSCSHLPLRC